MLTHLLGPELGRVVAVVGDLGESGEGAAALTVLADAAEWEGAAAPEMVTRDEMRRLKSAMGWGRRERRVPAYLTVLIAVLGTLAVVFTFLYWLRII